MRPRNSILLALLLTLAHSGAQEKFPIQLHRPAKLGEKFSYAAVGRLAEKIDVSVDGKTTENVDSAYRCELASAVEILAVDENGLPTEMRLEVFRFQKQGADEALALDLLGRGTQVHCKFTADAAEFSVAGKPVSDEVAEALGLVAMKLSSQSGETEDQVMGTKDPKAEGEAWKIDTARVAAALAKNGFHIGADALRGEARLTSVTKPAGGAAQFLSIDVTVIGEGISPELPLGYQLKSGTLTNTISRRFPTDPSLPCAGEEVSFEIVAEAEGKEAEATVNLKIHLQQSLKARYNRVAVGRE